MSPPCPCLSVPVRAHNAGFNAAGDTCQIHINHPSAGGRRLSHQEAAYVHTYLPTYISLTAGPAIVCSLCTMALVLLLRAHPRYDPLEVGVGGRTGPDFPTYLYLHLHLYGGGGTWGVEGGRMKGGRE